MLINTAITEAAALTGQVVPQATALRWLSELDGQLALEFYFAGEWAPYAEADLQSELAVPFPWDGGVYVHHLEAQTYFANGEYERYANARAMSESKLDEFRRHVQRMKSRCGDITIPLAGEGGSGVTVVDAGAGLWRYLSAYGTAVRHGFQGTPQEWLDSLIGGDGMSAEAYDPASAVKTAGGIPTYVAGQLAGYQTALTFDDAPTQNSANPVKSGGVYSALSGYATAQALAAKEDKIKRGTIALSATWSGSGPYTQTVAVTGVAVTANSKIDLQPTPAQLAALAEDGVTALVVENNAGTLTACALGAAASAAMTIQCTVTEVAST